MQSSRRSRSAENIEFLPEPNTTEPTGEAVSVLPLVQSIITKSLLELKKVNLIHEVNIGKNYLLDRKRQIT
jgi:hypothetical protein